MNSKSGQEVAKQILSHQVIASSGARNYLTIKEVGREGFEPSKAEPTDLQSAGSTIRVSPFERSHRARCDGHRA